MKKFSPKIYAILQVDHRTSVTDRQRILINSWQTETSHQRARHLGLQLTGLVD